LMMTQSNKNSKYIKVYTKINIYTRILINLKMHKPILP